MTEVHTEVWAMQAAYLHVEVTAAEPCLQRALRGVAVLNCGHRLNCVIAVQVQRPRISCLFAADGCYRPAPPLWAVLVSIFCVVR